MKVFSNIFLFVVGVIKQNGPHDFSHSFLANSLIKQPKLINSFQFSILPNMALEMTLEACSSIN